MGTTHETCYGLAENISAIIQSKEIIAIGKSLQIMFDDLSVEPWRNDVLDAKSSML
jgi:homospermidine synthase